METTHIDEGPEQISAEQILQEAYNKRRQLKPTTKVDILDLEELKEYQRRKRTEYEIVLKRNRLDLGQWMRYAQFEIEQHDLRRARSIFERALSVDSSYIPLWIRYIDFEIKTKNINHARNLLDRATNLLPRVDKLWFKYVMIEESLSHVEIVRNLFTKWCFLEPGTNAWDAFVEFEIRQQQFDKVRDIYSRYVMIHPQTDTWLKWVNFEKRHGEVDTVRKVYSLALDTLVSFPKIDEAEITKLIIRFVDWEATQQEYERCRALFKISIEKWPESTQLKDSLAQFEKKFGDFSDLENSIVYKRKRRYEQALKEDSKDYDTWWLYLDLIQENFPGELLEAFEKAVTGNQPVSLQKDIRWKRYIYLWIRYLVYMEIHKENIEFTRSLYKRLVKDVIPHKNFTFSKVWLMYSNFELRQGSLGSARKILGMSLGLCPKNKTFRKYIELEVKLKEFDRVRKLYEKYLEFNPTEVHKWIEYAELEENLGDEDRSRGIYEISLSDDVGLSKSDKFQVLERYINFETDSGEYSRARDLYRRYLDLTEKNVKVWVNWALFESSVPTEQSIQQYQEATNGYDEEEEFEFDITEENKHNTRAIFEEALNYFKQKSDTQNRIIVLEASQNYENVHGSLEDQERIQKRMPTIVKKRKVDNGIEKEYIDYVFPDDISQESKPDASKFLAMARKWKEQQRLKEDQ